MPPGCLFCVLIGSLLNGLHGTSATGSKAAFDYAENMADSGLSMVGGRLKRSANESAPLPPSNTSAVDVGIDLDVGNPWANVSAVEHRTFAHQYYNVSVHEADAATFASFWTDIARMLEAGGNVTGNTSHPQLANSYRRAVNADLQFDLPFYGHITKNVTIATGGFCYVGEHVHSWLAATQYVAPLMANFHTTSVDANILYADDGSKFVVQWNNVMLRQQQDVGSFTFQVALHRNGTIWFVYKKIPIKVEEVSDAHHPRKAGLSDAYLHEEKTDKGLQTYNKRVIYEYNRVEVDIASIADNVVVELVPNPVCITIKTCGDCTSAQLTDFTCHWCQVDGGKGSFCSDDKGRNRRRQDWLHARCDRQSKNLYCAEERAAVTPAPSPTDGARAPLERRADDDAATSAVRGGAHAGAVVFFVLFLVCFFSLVCWIVYAYHNPHTPSGQILIRYRPSRWHWPNSDVRYTASVHI